MHLSCKAARKETESFWSTSITILHSIPINPLLHGKCGGTKFHNLLDMPRRLLPTFLTTFPKT